MNNALAEQVQIEAPVRQIVCFMGKVISDHQDGVLTSAENNDQVIPKNTAKCRR